MAERIADLDMVHPVAKEVFRALRDKLATDFLNGLTKTKFEVFETYRNPLRQAVLKAQGNSKAGAFDSAHQHGLAVDFVPRNNGQWSWDLAHDWDYLRARCRDFGLNNEIPWDRPHVEHPVWKEVHKLLRKR